MLVLSFSFLAHIFTSLCAKCAPKMKRKAKRTVIMLDYKKPSVKYNIL